MLAGCSWIVVELQHRQPSWHAETSATAVGQHSWSIDNSVPDTATTNVDSVASDHGAGWRAIELFAGIGGFAAAWPSCQIQLAIDINQHGAETYRRNYHHPYRVAEIGSLVPADFSRCNSDLWWMSPPCQPYTRRGLRRDVDDPRAQVLLRVIELIEQCHPPAIALENVVGFGGSRMHARLLHALCYAGYQTQAIELCPTQLGWPNRRPRFYLLASQRPLTAWQPIPERPIPLSDLVLPLDEIASDDPAYWLDEELFTKIGSAIDRVDVQAANAITACFAGSYGKAWLHSGSYLLDGERYRRFSPREVARLLGFPDALAIDHLPPRTAWKLLGNSLSIAAVRYVLSHLTPAMDDR